MPVYFQPTMRATNMITLGGHFVIPGRPKTALCYTYNHSYVNQPHNASGKIGTTASSYLASRKRI